ncbi:head-tail connector protein [Marivita sp. S2033]|uniref:head-tail connector protein n=1 Tax=Marivita sp. S2033 TaxID=3373187 RepID=UPI003982A7BE
MFTLVRTTAPVEAPIALSEAKAQIRVDHNEEDVLIQHYIDAATSLLDGPAGLLGRCLVTQSWQMTVDVLGGPVHLPFPDTVIDEAKFADGDGENMPYRLEMCGQRPVLVPLQGRGRSTVISFTSGYGAPQDVPATLRQAMLLLIAHWYDNREAVTIGAAGTALPMAVDALIAPSRLQWI